MLKILWFASGKLIKFNIDIEGMMKGVQIFEEVEFTDSSVKINDLLRFILCVYHDYYKRK